MVGTNVKAETMSLMEKRSSMEDEMNGIIERLSQPGGPGLSGNLVDSEGFPRADIDVPLVVAERRRLSVLRNDHQEITEKINQYIQVLHGVRHAPKSSPPDSGNKDDSNSQNSSVVNAVASASSQNLVPRGSLGSIDVAMVTSIPFAMVDEIADASPAAEDGLQLGDRIVKFGNVEAGDNLNARLASESLSNRDRPVPTIIMRQGVLINLMVTPRTWHGRGLLGCHFRIL
ncbi:26S proteasome non-ATPase regulatory subunit 9 [Quillaja saponaria]|uniref:26S proteasome non-ATPase regulatory subunit 9 n=1 Tax=Quillaja saponaria TaxID=32244 RepID=A0AAD7QDU1_QUISA|nr:26S proteasome non-ATPase regulatory subunit 9 [Quillaja saponaria]